MQIQDESYIKWLDLKEELDDVLHTLIQTVPAQITESNEKIYINVKSK